MPLINEDTLDDVFVAYHSPSPRQLGRYATVREAARAFAQEILVCAPDSPERTLALRDVQRAMMMANAAIAVNE